VAKRLESDELGEAAGDDEAVALDAGAEAAGDEECFVGEEGSEPVPTDVKVRREKASARGDVFHSQVCVCFFCLNACSFVYWRALLALGVPKLAFFNETRHAYGRTALMLSGGAALGFYHIGLIR
jgi:hypothetical protein